MKDLKLTLKAAFANWLPWSKTLWKSYLLLAAVVSLFVYASMRVTATTLLPIAMFWSEIHDWILVLAIVGLGAVWDAVSLLMLVAALVVSVKTHRRMRAFVTQYRRREMGRSHRNVLTVNVVLLTLGSMIVALLPTVVLFVSYNVAALSGMMLDEVATPTWLHTAVLICTFVGVLFCEIVLTFARLCYREVSIPDNTPENESETSLSADLAAAVSAPC